MELIGSSGSVGLLQPAVNGAVATSKRAFSQQVFPKHLSEGTTEAGLGGSYRLVLARSGWRTINAHRDVPLIEGAHTMKRDGAIEHRSYGTQLRCEVFRTIKVTLEIRSG